MSKKKINKSGWYFDISSNLRVEKREISDQSNNGDYYHHDWSGPFKTFAEAKAAGIMELQLEINIAERRLSEFKSQKEPK